MSEESQDMSLQHFRSIGKKIIAIGRNYRDHAAEMKAPIPTKPMLFMKATSAYIGNMETIKIPVGCTDVNHEIELGVVIATKMSHVKAADAMKFVGGYAVALDMTARDWQNDAKKQGHPWFLSKSFDTSCPVSDFVDKNKIPNVQNVRLKLYINDKLQQNGCTKDMIFDVPQLLEYVTQYITLEPGDLLLTGTPAGVSTVNVGDHIRCVMSNEGNENAIMELEVGVERANE